MNFSFPYRASDFLLVKWQLLALLLWLVLLGVLFWATESLFTEARRDSFNAQANLRNARTALEQIEEEEATIIQYIGRYEQLDAEGIMDPEDRLLFLENMAGIRAEHDLFPINIAISEQMGFQLTYPPDDQQPGGPIDLKASSISLSLPLLHEEDFTRMLNSLLETRGLFQIKECSLRLRDGNRTSFTTLGQHFTAACEVYKYSFDLEPLQGGSS